MNQDDINWLVVFGPSLIAFIGVLAVTRSNIKANERAHRDRLQRESIADRRTAFADLLASWTERPVAEGKVRDANDRLQLLRDAIQEHGGQMDAKTQEKTLQLHDVQLSAVQERDAVIGRLVANRTIAQASVTDELSPLVLVAGLTILPDAELTPGMWDAFIQAMRADQEMDESKRQVKEARVRELLKPYASAVIDAGMTHALSPQGAGQGTDDHIDRPEGA